MRILVLSSEVWNDKINGNNVISNWFEGMEAEFANIYCSPEAPYNNCCKKYFQITDSMMLKSIITPYKAGKEINIKFNENSQEIKYLAEAEPKRLYGFLKKISGDFLRLVREIIWILGHYDIRAMQKFINDFQPDIIFSERMASCKILRLEKIVLQMCSVPIVAFTGDDEYSLRQLKFSPFFWINRFMVRKRLQYMVKRYSLYYTLSAEQKRDYEKRFGCNMKILQKCGELDKKFEKFEVNHPIKIIYAGKLYCNRWKALVQIADCLREINKDEIKIILQIYTKDNLTKRQKKLLNDGKNTFILCGVTQEELKHVYQKADIALHVESLDLKNRLITRLSFSTKIIDCIFSGCAVLAYCWKEQSGWKYLKRENAAICVSSKLELKHTLWTLTNHPEYICQYAKKAYDCGKNHHLKIKVQKMLINDFEMIMMKR